MSDQIKPELPSGFKDYSPSEVLARKRMLAAIERVYRRFGFVPLETSIGQKRLVLTGGVPSGMRMWDMRVSTAHITSDDTQRMNARFDLTVPLARYVAENMNTIAFPFRRYECGDVFRGESAQAGRYCQFKQFDADIVGAPTGPADAEIILCMAAVMRELGIERFLIKVNNRKILNGFAMMVGLLPGGNQATTLMRIMDKADKIGLEGVLTLLASKTADEEGEAIRLNLMEIKMVHAFMTLTEGLPDNDARLSALLNYFVVNEMGTEGVNELIEIAGLLKAGGMCENEWCIDSSVARGLGYYTGPVFETTLLDKPDFGSVYSGGRFDDLVARFTGTSLPSVGASVGVDRLFAALKVLGTVALEQSEIDVFIIRMDAKLERDYFALATELRNAGISVEIGMSHQETSIKAQMATALTRRAPLILFYGERERDSGTVQIKTTVDKQQKLMPRANLVAEALTLLGKKA